MSNIIYFSEEQPLDRALNEWSIHEILRSEEGAREMFVGIHWATRGYKFVISNPNCDDKHEWIILPPLDNQLRQETKPQTLFLQNFIPPSEIDTVTFPRIVIIP